MSVFVFPGQGAQHKGMGIELFDEFPDWVNQADDILGYSLRTLCRDNPDEKLHQTQYTQPALYVVNALSFLKRIRADHCTPRYLVGHSLGEYNALLAAEVFDFATGLRLVQQRGALMGEIKGGSMASIVKLRVNDISSALMEGGFSDLVLANYNSYTQTVMSGSHESIRAATLLLEKVGGLVIPINVSGAFHSPAMAQAQEKFLAFTDEFAFHKPKIPVIANVDARPYRVDQLKLNLVAQLSGAVRWCESIEYLLDQGEDVFEEIGPGNILSKLIQRIRINQ